MSTAVLKLQKPNFLENCFLILFLLKIWIKYIFQFTIYIKKMPGVKSIGMKSIRTTVHTS